MILSLSPPTRPELAYQREISLANRTDLSLLEEAEVAGGALAEHADQQGHPNANPSLIAREARLLVQRLLDQKGNKP